MKKMASVDVADRVRGAMWGLYIGDALAMPVHWYYDLRQLKADFGQITKYEAPMPQFRGSIMNLSNTGGAGRGSDKGEIVGSVILHGKKKFWMKGENYHYHHGMKPGENTLEAQLSRVFMRSLVQNGGANTDDFRQNYITFMTTPGSHRDTYASTCHRMFFENLTKGVEPKKCPSNDQHNVDSIDGLILPIPVVLANLDKPFDELKDLVSQTINVTRGTKNLDAFGGCLADMLVRVVNGEDLKTVAAQVGEQLGVDVPRMVQMATSDPMTA
jgi:ADP-ribosylglycohydrolase